MYQAILKTVSRYSYGLVVACLFTLLAGRGAWAVPINSIPGAVTCKVGEPGQVGDDFEGFYDPELNGGKGGLEIDLGSFDGVDCGPNVPGVEPPPLHPISDAGRKSIFINGVRYLLPGDNDILLHGRYILHGMYGFFNNGVYGVYNLHGVYDVQGSLLDGKVYNFDRFGDAHAPIPFVPEPTAAVLLGSGLLGWWAGTRRR